MTDDADLVRDAMRYRTLRILPSNRVIVLAGMAPDEIDRVLDRIAAIYAQNGAIDTAISQSEGAEVSTPSVAEVVARLHELVHAITQGRESLLREFTMRVPAEPKRDADLVLSTAASLLESEHAARVEAERKAAYWNERFEFQCKMGDKAGMDLYSAMMRAESAERELAVLRNRPCPYVHSSREGTHYCTLPHAAEKELAELRKRVAEAPMVTFRLGYAEGLFEVDSAQEDHLVPTGQRVAILPLREGE